MQVSNDRPIAESSLSIVINYTHIAQIPIARTVKKSIARNID